MKNLLLLISLILLGAGAQAQYSVIGGFGADFGFKTQVNPRNSFQLGIELPESESHSIRVTAGYFAPINLEDSQNNLTAELRPEYTGQGSSIINVPKTERISQFSIEFGRRNYLINTFDDGIAFFYGSNTRASLVSDVISIGDFDSEKYYFPDNPDYNPNKNKEKYHSIILGVGASAGFKYQLLPHWRSAIFAEVIGEYNIMIYDQARVLGYFISPINFAFRIGYRYDFF